MNAPPYWPFRCAACSRFASNPAVALGPDTANPYGDVVITEETGDCKKCGKHVPLKPLGWDDWFTDDFNPAALFAAATTTSTEG